MHIVLLNGHVACLKTTLSYLLAPVLSLAHVSTSVCGSFSSDPNEADFVSRRHARYRVVQQAVAAYARNGVSVIVDGTFARREWRRMIYDEAIRGNADDVVLVTCVSSDPSAVRTRFAHRSSNPSVPDAEADLMDAYWGSVNAFEPTDDDVIRDGRRPSRVIFDSASYTVRVLDDHAGYGAIVARAIETLVRTGALKTPLFGSSVAQLAPETTRLWVELEGIGGCGKTSQAALLVAGLRGRFPSRRIVLVSEFSRSSLGDLIRENLRNLRFALSAESGVYEILYTLADAAEKGWEATVDTQWDIAVVDRYRWSIASHMIALAPFVFPDSKPSALIETSERIAALLPLPAAQRMTIYLRCAPDVALNRVEQRTSATLDARDRRFVQHLHNAFESLSSRHPEFHQIDAAASEDETSRSLLDLITSHAAEPA